MHKRGNLVLALALVGLFLVVLSIVAVRAPGDEGFRSEAPAIYPISPQEPRRASEPQPRPPTRDAVEVAPAPNEVDLVVRDSVSGALLSGIEVTLVDPAATSTKSTVIGVTDERGHLDLRDAIPEDQALCFETPKALGSLEVKRSLGRVPRSASGYEVSLPVFARLRLAVMFNGLPVSSGEARVSPHPELVSSLDIGTIYSSIVAGRANDYQMIKFRCEPGGDVDIRSFEK